MTGTIVPVAVAYVRTNHKIGPTAQRGVCVDACDEAGYDLRYWVEGDLSALHAAYTVIGRGDAEVLVVSPHVLGLVRPDVVSAVADIGGRLHVARDATAPTRTTSDVAAQLRKRGMPVEEIADIFGVSVPAVRALLRRGGWGKKAPPAR